MNNILYAFGVLLAFSAGICIFLGLIWCAIRLWKSSP